jgi:extracellular solute-binding protein
VLLPLLGLPSLAVAAPPGAASKGGVVLEVVYGEEKATWLSAQLERFSNGPGGAAVEGRVMAAAGLAEGLVSKSAKPDVYCATSTAELHQVNHAWLQSGQTAPIVGPGLSVARSPLVWVMPASAAQALGWPQKPFEWKDFIQWSSELGKWKALGHPEWEPFRFAHVNPELGAAGLLAVNAELRAAAQRELSAAVIGSARVQETLEQVERANLFYGNSTGFFLKGLAEHGPRFLSIAYAFENQVVEHNLRGGDRPSLVAVYPAEGAPVADHPCAILDAPWVDAPRRAAAERLLAFLRSPEAQREALQRGLRPVDESTPLPAPFDAARGVDPARGRTAWAVPDRPTVAAALSAWKTKKRSYSAVLALDRSKHMAGRPIESARKTLQALLTHLNRAPGELSFFFFTAEPHETVRPPPGSQPRPGPSPIQDGFEMPGLKEYLPFEKLPARGPATLYEAVMESQSFANGRLAGYLQTVGANPNRTSFAIIFTAGVHDPSNITLEQLLRFLRYEPVEEPRGPRPDLNKTLTPPGAPRSVENAPPRYQLTVPIFFVVYGERADRATLERIAATAGGAVIDARGRSPEAIARQLASFF